MGVLLDRHQGGIRLVTEFEVRRELDAIEAADLHPRRKARRLLALARIALREARKIAKGAAILSLDCMDEQASRLRRVVARMETLGRDVRHRARRLLAGASAPRQET